MESAREIVVTKRSISPVRTVRRARDQPAKARKRPKTHRLEVTPETVAYGYYWSEAKPVLRIASGDIIDVDTLLASNPTALRARASPTARSRIR